MRRSITAVLLTPVLLTLSPIAVLALARAEPSGDWRAARGGLRAARAAGLSRVDRLALGRQVRDAARGATRADRQDLTALLRDPSLRVTGDATGRALEGSDHRVSLVAGKLALTSKRLEWSPIREWGQRGFITRGPFRYIKPKVKALDTRTGREVELDYVVYGQVGQDPSNPKRVVIFDPTVEPVAQAHNYRYKPGPSTMKTVLRAVGREFARLYPDASQLAVWRDRDTAGYTAMDPGSTRTRPKDAQKDLEYNMSLFR